MGRSARGGRFAIVLALALGLAAPAGLAQGEVAIKVEGSGGPSAAPGVDRPFPERLVAAANERTKHEVAYDGRYVRLEYPGGDVPSEIGVCTDVVIRAYRAVGIDLQQAVHEDMRAAFEHYPRNWGLERPDPNIDHRRVPNLRTFFARHGESLVPSQKAAAYRPGDLVTWMLGGRLPHIGIVVDGRSEDGQRPLVVHNVGQGPRREDVLFAYPITGHYRFSGGGSAN